MTVVVRPVEARDALAWRELFAAYGRFYETEFTEEILDRVWAQLGTEGSGIDAIVAELDERVVGFAHHRSHPDTFTGGRSWFLDDLFVAPEARSAGTGAALIERVAALARETSPGATLRWITAADNERARRVYDRVATRTSWVTYELAL